MIKLRSIRKNGRKLHKRASSVTSNTTRKFNGKTLLEYRGDIEGYVKHVLKAPPLTEDQLTLIKQVDSGVRRIFCRAGHIVGKSYACAVLVSYLYDTYEECIIITTAPRLDSVKKIVWRELRAMRRRAGLGGFTGPRSIQLESSETHLAYGTTARTHSAMQGAHGIRVFIIIDEATGVEAEFWEAIETMLSGEEFALVAIYNPTTTACQAYAEEKHKSSWVHTINCLNHPNIKTELSGEKAPYPAAVRLAWVHEHIEKWCDPLLDDEPKRPTDFQFPPPAPYVKKEVCHTLKVQPGQWWRPGPIAEARILGRWPTSAVNTFWSESLIEKCKLNRIEIKPSWRVAIGVDVARYGDDMTVICVRWGLCVVHIEEHSGWTGDVTAGRIKQLAQIYHGPEKPTQVRVYIDETGGWGTGVIDNAGVGESKYNFLGVCSASKEGVDDELHYNIRTMLWATTVELARRPDGGIDFSRIPKHMMQALETQLTSQTYKLLPNGAIQATSKDDIKKELKQSPDLADALNLCFFSG